MLRFLLLLEPGCLEKCNDDAKTASYLSVFSFSCVLFYRFLIFFRLNDKVLLLQALMPVPLGEGGTG